MLSRGCVEVRDHIGENDKSYETFENEHSFSQPKNWIEDLCLKFVKYQSIHNDYS